MRGSITVPLDIVSTWPLPNYVDPVTQPKYVLLVACVIAPISVALLIARLWIRVRVQRDSGLDDWVMLTAFVPLLTLTAILPIITEKYHANRHVWDIEPPYWVKIRIFVFFTYILFAFASGLIKISVLLFYRRLSERVVGPAFRWTLRITIAIIALYTFAFTFKPLLVCGPIHAFWDQVSINKIIKGDFKYKCINEGADITANGIIATAQDFLAVFFPSVLCWKLQISLRQKLALYAVFAVSYSTVAIGVLRSYVGYHLFFKTWDATWVTSYIYALALLELHVGSMCANAPAIKTLYAHYTKRGPHRPFKLSPTQSRDSEYSSQPSTNPSRSKFTWWRNLREQLDGKFFVPRLNTIRFTTKTHHITIPSRLSQPAAFSHPIHERQDSMSKPFASDCINPNGQRDHYNRYQDSVEIC